jgi:hypothetical protein
MTAILAFHLGKFKTVSYLLTEDHSSIPVSTTIMTNPKKFEQLLLDLNRHCWLSKLARALDCHS